MSFYYYNSAKLCVKDGLYCHCCCWTNGMRLKCPPSVVEEQSFTTTRSIALSSFFITSPLQTAAINHHLNPTPSFSTNSIRHPPWQILLHNLPPFMQTQQSDYYLFILCSLSFFSADPDKATENGQQWCYWSWRVPPSRRPKRSWIKRQGRVGAWSRANNPLVYGKFFSNTISSSPPSTSGWVEERRRWVLIMPGNYAN